MKKLMVFGVTLSLLGVMFFNKTTEAAQISYKHEHKATISTYDYTDSQGYSFHRVMVECNSCSGGISEDTMNSGIEYCKQYESQNKDINVCIMINNSRDYSYYITADHVIKATPAGSKFVK